MTNKLTAYCIVLLFSWTAVSIQAESYASLDKKIVEAYNASPKRTRDVYRYAMQIIEKTNLDHSRKGRNWREKAQRLITIVSYIEADRAIDNHDNRQVYLWAMRGVTNGAARGELDGISIKQIYDLLNDWINRLSRTAEIKRISYGRKMLLIRDYHRVKADNHLLSRDKRNFAGQLIEKNPPYTLVEGPTEDNSGNIYVKIRTNFGGMVTIQYDDKRGWHSVVPLATGGVVYYPSWQSCATANSRLHRQKQPSVTTIKNSHIEQKIYYVPKKISPTSKVSPHRNPGDD